MRVYLLVALVACAGTFLIVPAVRLLAIKFGVFTPVRDRDVHDHPIARLGGLAMFAGFLFTLAVFSREPFVNEILLKNSEIIGIVLGATTIVVVGFVDDVWDIDWITKLLGQILAAGLMAWKGVQIITIPVGGLTIISPTMSLVLTVLFVVACMNAVNFVDGIDGLAAGVLGIGAIGLFFYAYGLTRATNPADYSSLACIVLAATIGMCIGFLIHNFHPASVFMGDTGAMILGLLVAGSTIILTGQIDPMSLNQRELFPVFVPILLPFAALIFPLADMCMAVVRRVSAGKSPTSADGIHIHHRLIKAAAGSQRRAVGTLYVWAAAVTVPVVSLLYVRSVYSLIMLVIAIVISGFAAWVLLPGLPYRFRTRRARRLAKSGRK